MHQTVDTHYNALRMSFSINSPTALPATVRLKKIDVAGYGKR